MVQSKSHDIVERIFMIRTHSYTAGPLSLWRWVSLAFAFISRPSMAKELEVEAKGEGTYNHICTNSSSILQNIYFQSIRVGSNSSLCGLPQLPPPIWLPPSFICRRHWLHKKIPNFPVPSVFYPSSRNVALNTINERHGPTVPCRRRQFQT